MELQRMGHEEVEPVTRHEILVKSLAAFAFVCACALCIGAIVYSAKHSHDNDNLWLPPKPEIELVSMDFTVLNITRQTHHHRLSAKWDLSIRIPYNIPDLYICLQGDLQASILYKQNITLATSTIQKYNNLKYSSPQLLKISEIVSDEDIIRIDIMEDIKEKKEVKFGTQLFLTDCRKNMEPIMSFACDEATLRFEPGSEMKATLFGNHPTCTISS